MRKLMLTVVLISTMMSLAGCFLNQPEAVHHIVEGFNLSWKGDSESQAIYTIKEKDEFGGIKIIDQKVFAIGNNEDFIVALQQPKTSPGDTVYHIIDRRKFDRFWSPAENVYRFQTKQEFQAKKQELGVPDLEIQTIIAPEI